MKNTVVKGLVIALVLCPVAAFARAAKTAPTVALILSMSSFMMYVAVGRMDAIRQVGPEFCFLSEFWTKVDGPREYAGAAGVGAFADVMRLHGFTNRELEMMFKENPAKALGLPVTTENRI
jgi:hypothetical protein